MNLSNLGNRIVAKRKEHGLKQTDLAYPLFLSPQAVSKWELGKNAPGIEHLVPLSKLLHCSIEYILTDE